MAQKKIKAGPPSRGSKQGADSSSRNKWIFAAVIVGVVGWASMKYLTTMPPEGGSSPSGAPPSHKPDVSKLGVKQSSYGITEPLFETPFDPDGPGQRGLAVVVPRNQKSRADELFKIHQFNLIASDMIGINRTLPDYRFDECKKKKYPKQLPDTSVIIVFHNEAWSTLLRTLVSIIDNTPAHLLREIIMIDDGSTFDHLFGKLEKAVKELPAKVLIDRMPVRSGLVQSRLRGAELAEGDVLTFLDSHIECVTGWLEPLLAEVKRNRKVVACPLIDVISDENFAYQTAHDGTAAGFNWKMLFSWKYLDEKGKAIRAKDRSIPIRSPTMAGGLYSIDRLTFWEMGSYDRGFIVWGGENLEMSFRMWMCGGEIVIVTCSRVGHVFRKVTPYEWPGGVQHVLSVNALRTAYVWLDEYKDWFVKNIPDSANVAYGDVSERLEFRKKLGCKSFRWYLENVYPESPIPLDFYSLGYIRSYDGKNCLDTAEFKTVVLADLIACHYEGANQLFAISAQNQIMGAERMCVSHQNERVSYAPCNPANNVNDEQRWSYNPDTKQIKHHLTGMCMDVPTGITVVLSKCKSSASTQKWDVQDFHPKMAKP